MLIADHQQLVPTTKEKTFETTKEVTFHTTGEFSRDEGLQESVC
jgi:hypothetical protein